MTKKALSIIIALIAILACKDETSNKIYILDKSEINHAKYLKSAIPFQRMNDDGKRYIRKKGGVGGINLQKPQLDKLIECNSPVIDDSKAVLVMDFPSKKSIAYEIYNEKGFTKKELVTEISQAYSIIYDEKEKYEISYRNLSDLELCGILKYQKDNVTYLVTRVELIK
ncbi:hypothetical protein [Aquimarina brevivitae]|uniref:Lipoprotein n=1 Tax=Aquimarina brevivitae TaxID=323412 RepID=A0A4Q7P181_9FLAO|nr:hypothetical protein [Aquimarina brevivitae]RZS93586.1 hypothetical protein EV197_2166 [Aquimarina brevivitae]